MSAMRYDRNPQPALSNIMKTAIAADALEQEKQQLDEGLYLERDTLLDDDFFDASLDDYDDLLSAADYEGDWNDS